MEDNKKTKEEENEENIPEKEEPEENVMETNFTETINSFDELGLKEKLKQGIYGFGFEHPSIIQKKAILPILQGRDLIAQAQSGTGKTGAFIIGTLQLIDETKDDVQCLVLSPTRELATQTAEIYAQIGEVMGVNVNLLIGGTNLRSDYEKLGRSPQVLVGSVGRVLDLINRKKLNLSYLQNFVLDEADIMLDRGFIDKIKQIIKLIPSTCKILLFSATMPRPIVELTNLFMKDPAKILVKDDELTLEGIRQYYVYLKKEDKLDVLLQIYKGVEIAQAIIYCNSKKTCDNVAKEMRERGHMISVIYGEMPQSERSKIMQEFRAGSTRVLICTNLLARGIDVYQVNLVINYDMPKDKETYIHRIGRSGRYGRKGNAINFVTPNEKEDLENIQKYYSTSIEMLPSDLSEMK